MLTNDKIISKMNNDIEILKEISGRTATNYQTKAKLHNQPRLPWSYQRCNILVFLSPDRVKLGTSCKQGCQGSIKLIITDKLGEENITCLIPRKTIIYYFWKYFFPTTYTIV